MGQVTIRNLDDDLIERVKVRARLHHRSLEGELRAIVAQAVAPASRELLARVEQICKGLSGRWQGDSTALIREDRDR